MKHLKSYNEGFFTSKYDKAVTNIFNKIKEFFDHSKLQWDVEEYSESYTYELEETDSPEGFIKIVIENDTDIAFPFAFTLYVDDKEIPCSRVLRRSIYRFFKKKYNEPEKTDREKSLDEFRKKYE